MACILIPLGFVGLLMLSFGIGFFEPVSILIGGGLLGFVVWASISYDKKHRSARGAVVSSLNPEFSAHDTEYNPSNLDGMGKSRSDYAQERYEQTLESQRRERQQREDNYVAYSPDPDRSKMGPQERKDYDNYRSRGYSDDDWKRAKYRRKRQ